MSTQPLVQIRVCVCVHRTTITNHIFGCAVACSTKWPRNLAGLECEPQRSYAKTLLDRMSTDNETHKQSWPHAFHRPSLSQAEHACLSRPCLSQAASSQAEHVCPPRQRLRRNRAPCTRSATMSVSNARANKSTMPCTGYASTDA